MKKVCVIIDGGNFYHLVLKKLGILESDFDFDAFVNFISGEREIINEGKRFYTGTVREKEGDERSKKAMSRQTKFFSILKSGKWQIKTSKLRERKEEVIVDSRMENFNRIKKLGIDKIEFVRDREKGIDVKIAVDLIAGALDGKYDIAILVSSDTDLVPAIDWVRNRTDKKVEYIGFSIEGKYKWQKPTTPLLSMISKTDIQRTFVESDLKQFIKKR